MQVGLGILVLLVAGTGYWGFLRSCASRRLPGGEVKAMAMMTADLSVSSDAGQRRVERG